MTTQTDADLPSQDTINSEDRIECYLQTKQMIVAECKEHVLPLFRGLLNELVEAARAINSWPPSSDEWIDEMKRLFESLKPLLNKAAPAEVKPLIDILSAYQAATGIELSYVCADESGMEGDEIILGFKCLAWRELSKNELNTTAIAITQANLYLTQFDPDSVVDVTIPHLHYLDLEDMVVIRNRLNAYWGDHLIWSKYRSSFG